MGKKRLAGDIVREATSDEVRNLKETLAELLMEDRLLKKSMIKERTVYEYSASQKFEIIRLSITYRNKRTQLQKNYGYVNEDTKKYRKAM